METQTILLKEKLASASISPSASSRRALHDQTPAEFAKAVAASCNRESVEYAGDSPSE